MLFCKFLLVFSWLFELGMSNFVFFFFGGLLKLLSDFSFKVCIFFVSGLCCSL